MTMQLICLGAAETVTGSKYLLEAGGQRLLIDCGLFQGIKSLRRRNWEPLGFDPASIDAVLLTHAHIDHSGYLPLLARSGYRGPVYCSRGTRDLCGLLLPDCGHLLEEDARLANAKGFSRHRPALPLYTRQDAEACLSLLRSVPFGERWSVAPGIEAWWSRAGHILGAACVHLQIGGKHLVFSGDVGRPNDVLMLPPKPLGAVDVLVVESTYGDRLHSTEAPDAVLAEVIRSTAALGGTVLIPTFAVGRAQELLHWIGLLKQQHRIPDLPVFLNSPMAIDATEMFCRYSDEHRLSPQQCAELGRVARYVNSVEESIKLNQRPGPMIILSASGMATGGRVLHHLKTLAPDARNSIVFAGYQAMGTRGEAMVHGASEIKIHGAMVPVRARVVQIDSLSAHADYSELLDWLSSLTKAPRRVFVTHGEPQAADAFRKHLAARFGWHAEVPRHGEVLQLAE